MRKRKLFIFGLISAILIFFFLNFTSTKNTSKIDLPKLEDKKREDLSAEKYVEDFDFVYDTLLNYYPFFEINKIVYNTDWLSMKDEYQEYISKSNNDADFAYRMNFILNDLHNGHTYIVDKNEAVETYISYYRLPESNWRHDISDIYEKSTVRYRYNLTNKSINNYLKYNSYKKNSNLSMNSSLLGKANSFSNNDLNNVLVEDINNDIAYIKIKKMLSLEDRQNDERIIKKYLKTIENKKALVIDIRGNSGGDSRYWQNFLLPSLIRKPYETSYYHFIRKGDLNKKVIAQERYKEGVSEFLKASNLTDDKKELLQKFDYYNISPAVINPNEDSIKFKGKIYLLVNSSVYSSSEMMASFCSETNLATLVGERTGGDGIGTDPMQIDLPNSGYVLRFSKEMGLTKSGKINEIEKTNPNIVIDSNSYASLLDQPIIHKIIELESH